MERLSLCRICLASDVRLCSISRNLQDTYEQLTAITFQKEDGRPLVACYICLARLQNSYRLRTSCLQSDELLTQMLSSEMSISQEVYGTNTLIAELVLNISIGNMLQKGAESLIKEEAMEVIDNTEIEDIEDEVLEETLIYEEDSQDVIKWIPNGVETDAEDIMSDKDDITIEENKLEPDDASLLSQSADILCPKIVKIVLERIDLNDTNIGTSVTTQTRSIESISRKHKRNNQAETEVEELKINNKHKIIGNIDRTLLKHRDKEKSFKVLKLPGENQFQYNNNTHIGKKSCYCEICKRYYTSKTSLKDHMRVHNIVKLYICDKCKKYFKTKTYFNRHMRTHTGEKPYFCVKCKRCFSTKTDLNFHMQTHTGGNLYSCDLCKTYFKTTGLLNRHMRAHTSEKRVSCDMCKRCFSTRSQLIRHIRTHTGEKPYSCYKCNKCFRAKIHLDGHIRIHTGEKPYPCKICKKCFRTSSQLNGHMRTHTGEKPFLCKICKKRFRTTSQLNGHMRTHTGEKPYSCGICKKSFSDHSNFKVHERTHTSEKLFGCDICKKCFSNKAYLKAHIRTHC